MSRGVIDQAFQYLGSCVHIIASGTSGIWTYRKYSDGTYDAWADTAVNLQYGTGWMGGYYHKTTSALTPPTFSQSVLSMTAETNGAQLAVYCGRDGNYYTYWMNAQAAAVSNIPVRLKMTGTWK